MRKILSIVLLLIVAIKNINAQEIYPFANHLNESIQVPYTPPEYNFIERQTEIANREYEESVNRERTPEQVNVKQFVSYKHYNINWNERLNEWEDGPEETTIRKFYLKQGTITIVNELENANTLNIIKTDSTTDNSKFSFIKWICHDVNNSICWFTMFLDKTHNILFFFVQTFDMEGYETRRYTYVILTN